MSRCVTTDAWARDRLQYGRYRAYRRIAPYPGYRGHGLWLTWLSIPKYVVDCESGGDWLAANPSSDARGPYQELDQGEPYPAVTWRQKMANHRIAAQIWATVGPSAWACA